MPNAFAFGWRRRDRACWADTGKTASGHTILRPEFSQGIHTSLVACGSTCRCPFGTSAGIFELALAGGAQTGVERGAGANPLWELF